MPTLDGKVAIVTGAGTGIGRSAAIMLAAEGAQVVVVGRRPEPLEAVVQEITNAGGQAVARPTDLEDGNAAADLATSTIEAFGRVDILVNNAGYSSKIRSIRYVQPDEWENVFRINVEAVYRLTQACLPNMIERGDGAVITTSSMAALTPGILGGAPYSAAKAASYNLMRGLNAELRSLGIRATTIIPGEVDTPILNGRPSPPSDDARATMMQPEDVAGAILLCATMPGRTLVEEIVMTPAIPRNMDAELAVARSAGADQA